ncbi:MAG: hypothetical protein ABFC96_12935 [Thermoguttaceae bacterium]
MPARTGKRLLLAAAMALSICAQPAVCLAIWPFTSETKADTASKRIKLTTAKKTPSTWDKMTSALSFKKSPPKKQQPVCAVPRQPKVTPKATQSKSWFGSWFKSSEPAKPKSVSDWMDGTKRIDP